MLRLAALLSIDVRQTARDTSDRAQGAADSRFESFCERALRWLTCWIA
jgi:hypothetical protein